MNNTKYNITNLIDTLTKTAIELVENTDLMDIDDVENSCSTIKIDDRYQIDIIINYGLDNKNKPNCWWVWFNLIDDNCSKVVLGEDSKDVLLGNIRKAATGFMDSLVKFNIITAE